MKDWGFGLFILAVFAGALIYERSCSNASNSHSQPKATESVDNRTAVFKRVDEIDLELDILQVEIEQHKIEIQRLRNALCRNALCSPEFGKLQAERERAISDNRVKQARLLAEERNLLLPPNASNESRRIMEDLKKGIDEELQATK